MLKKQALGEQIKEKIMDDILENRLKPGERLVESALAKKYGVSQAPVREALRALQALRLVRSEPYTGTVVRKFTRKDLEEFFVVRSAIEGLAGRLAATHCTDADVAELQRILDDMIKAQKKKDYARRMEMNTAFHSKLIAISANSLLIETAENLRASSWSKVTGTHTRMDPQQLVGRHQVFIDLLKKRDADGLEKAMVNHIRDSMEFFFMESFPHNPEE